MLADYGIDVPDNTLGGWIMKSAEQLEPLGAALWNQLSLVNVLQADETPVKILDPEKKAYMWLYHSYMPGQCFVIFDFNLNRSGDIVNERLKNFKGILQTDGYSGYNQQRQRKDIISIGCWDHARRKFADVVKASGENKSGKAGTMLEKIGKLYEIEREIKNFSFDQRKIIRQEKAVPLLKFISEFLHKINAPPKSLLGIAVTYCKNQWNELIRYIDYGEAQISNCWIENQVRPFAIGRRNWLFIGNELSAQRAALLYSLIQSCELNNIDPRAYLEYVLKQVHHIRRKEIDPAILLPHTINKILLEN
jgi:transposase